MGKKRNDNKEIFGGGAALHGKAIWLTLVPPLQYTVCMCPNVRQLNIRLREGTGDQISPKGV